MWLPEVSPLVKSPVPHDQKKSLVTQKMMYRFSTNTKVSAGEGGGIGEEAER